MQDKILIVDDNYEIISFIKPALESEGFLVEYATTGMLAMEKVTEDLSLILLDVMLPHFSGFDICKRIRNRVPCPILFLTARGLEEERIKGFLVGGDDYIVKPFSLKELILRIKVHIRRYHAGEIKEKNSMLEFGALVIDIVNRTVTINSVELELTKKEFDIIELLATHPGQVFSKEQIFEALWGFDSDSNLNTVTEHVRRIRTKFLSKHVKLDFIKTVWGIGYKWQ